jgi:HSP20 family protein
MLPILRPNITNFLSSFRKEHDEMDRLLDQMLHFHGMPTIGTIESPSFSPALEFRENENEYNIYIEVPGLEKDGIEISVNDDTLVLKGEKKYAKEERGEVHINEIHFGSFRREIPLPKNCNKEKIDASYKNGILTLSLPKIEEKKPERKKIEVKIE